MSQTQCQRCYAPLSPGQQTCSNCGAAVAPSGNMVPPTIAASSSNPSYPPPPNVGGVAPTQFADRSSGAPQPPNVGGVAPTQMAGDQGSNSPYAAPPPPNAYPNSSYGPPSGPYGGAPVDPYAPPPPPTDAYGGSSGPAYNPQVGSYGPAPTYDPYAPNPSFPSQQKKSPTGLIIGGVILALLVVCGGGFLAVRNLFPSSTTTTSTGSSGTPSTSNGNNGGQNFSKEQKLNNLTVVYASDKITFTSIQQAEEFEDDSLTQFSSSKKSNYVRVNFKEEQTATRSSYFSYRSTFQLLLPDKSTAEFVKSSETSGPKEGEQRENWVDFETKEPVDLTQLTMRLGSSSEQQMEFPLKDGADVSKFLPKKTTPNKQFQYALLDWTVTGVTQGYYFEGQQAKKGKVFVAVELKADNNTSDTRIYLYSNFANMKSGSTVVATSSGSDTSDFGSMPAGTTNHMGVLVFEVPQASQYTLQFKKSEDWEAVDVEITP